MLGHSTLRLEDTFGETFTAPGAPLILPSPTPLLDALRTVGAELSAPAVERPLVKVNSAHAQRIYLHPFTQLAIERGRQRRAALEAQAGGQSSQPSDESKDPFEGVTGIDTYRSLDGLAEATGLDSARGTETARGTDSARASSSMAATARGAPAMAGGLSPSVRSAFLSGDRKGDEWSPRAFDGVAIAAASTTGVTRAGVSARLGSGRGDAGKQLLHAALD